MNKSKTDLIPWESNFRKSTFSIEHSLTSKKKKLSGFNTMKPYFDNLFTPIFKGKA